MAENSRKKSHFERSSIAIIAILAGMLLPALNQAREKARASNCISNQKQLYLAWISYAEDNKEFVVPAAGAYVYKGVLRSSEPWPSWLPNFGYLPGEGDVDYQKSVPSRKYYICPTDRTPYGKVYNHFKVSISYVALHPGFAQVCGVPAVHDVEAPVGDDELLPRPAQLFPPPPRLIDGQEPGFRPFGGVHSASSSRRSGRTRTPASRSSASDMSSML